MTITLKRTVNLSEPVLPEVLSAPLYEGEKNAHTFMITAEKDKLPHALSGSVVAYFERNDGNTVRVEGETKDGAAVLTLSPECYQTGVFYLAVMLISDGAQTVIYAASGRVRNTQDGEIINGGDAIPSYDEIMAHLNKYLAADIIAKVEETEDGALITMKDVVHGETLAFIKNGDTNVFLVREIIDGISDKTKEEAEAAAKAGKAVLLVTKYGEVYTYYGKEKIPGTNEYAQMFVMPITKASTGKRRNVIYLRADNALLRKSETPFTAVAENPLIIKTGDTETSYDGSERKEIDLSNLGSGGTISSPTNEEVLNALAENDLIMAVMDTDGGILADENGTIIEW